MKKLTLLGVIFFSLLLFKQANAQISLSINIGTQPTWGPTGYNHVDYYYLPDIDCYYYVPTRQFIYLNGSSWVWASSLPPQYGSYDLYSGYKVVINSPKPYLQNNTYRGRYASYKGRRGQAIIRDSHDAKYKRPTTRPANNHRPVAKSKAKRTVNKRPAAKPRSKASHPAAKGQKDDHHK